MKQSKKISLDETFVDTANLPGFDTARFEGVLEHLIKTRVFWMLGGIFFTVGMLLMGRAGYIMIIEGSHYALRAEDNRLAHHAITPERGIIYDRTGIPLAYNIPGFRVVVDTRGRDRDRLLSRVGELAEVLQRDTTELVSLIQRHWEQGEIVVELVREWNTANMLLTRFKDETAIRVEPAPLRAYLAHPAFGHVVGYVSSPDDPVESVWSQAGKTGVERAYNMVLRGNPGVKIVEMNSRSAVLSEGVYRREGQGKNVVLSISADLQKTIYNAIQETAEERGFIGGSAVALDVRTGEVLALVSYPGFDANVMSTGAPREEVSRILADERHPLFSRAVAGLYPPASTIKPFLAAAAIDERVVSPETIIYTEGRIVVPNPFDPNRPAVFKDWRNHGPVDMIRALTVSSDAYFYTIGGGHGRIEGLGVERMHDYLVRFGIGQKTGIDFLGEVEGLVPNKEWKIHAYPDDSLWRVGDSYNMSIGQGWLLATPLQMARATLALARDGELLQPRLAQSVVYGQDGNEQKEYLPVSVPLPVSISHDALRVVRRGMRSAVTEGTAIGVAGIRPPVAAKTGTAEVNKLGRTHSWFIGFLPWEKPELVLVINMENGPAGNLVGAVSVAHKVLQWFSTAYVDKHL